MSPRMQTIVIAAALLFAALAIALFARAVGNAFGPMYQDFEARLPRMTMALFMWQGQAMYGSLVLLPMPLLIWPRRRWIAVALSGVLAVIAIALIFWGAYAPIFEIAGNVRAD